MLRKIVSLLFYKIRKFSGYIPHRENEKLKDSFVHESVSINDVNLGGNNSISRDCTLIGNIKLGKYSTIGERTTLHGGLIEVGNYCQFGPNSAVYAINHATGYLTTYNNKRLFDSELKEISEEGEIKIGHGVWIGHGACILKGVSIGNGAVVGANSLVTKDIPAYSIAVGNPAIVIRSRFSKSVCIAIDDSQWWTLDPKELEPYKYLFMKKISHFQQKDFNVLSKLKGSI